MTMHTENKTSTAGKTQSSHDEQVALWNGVAGNAWVDAQGILDQVFAPLEDVLTGAARACQARRVLDVGCGTGGTTLALARALGAESRCVGVDISAPMIEAARQRAPGDPSLEFVVADAQTHDFPAATFDLLVSRFGVMFFDDPVAAFANLRRAMRPGGILFAIVWRDAAENPFMTAAERAAAPLLPELPARRPGEPGQFAFADASRVERVLRESGWRDIDIRPLDVPCTFAAEDLTTYISRLGPVGRVLPTLDAARQQQIVEAIRPAFDRYVEGTEVRVDAACWVIGAHA